MKGVFLLAAIASLPRSASAKAVIGAKTFPAEAVRAISVRTDGGAISLDVASGKIVSADVLPSPAPGDDCVIDQSLRGGTLTLSAHPGPNPNGGAPKSCSAGFSASAPAGVRIQVRSRDGNVEVGPFSGKIDVRTGSGAITLHRVSGELTLRTSSGTVTGRVGGQQNVDIETGSGGVYLRGLTGSAKARAAGGIIALAWAAAPLVGEIDVRTDSGDFRALLPEDARLKFSLTTRSGKVRNDFSSDASASLLLSFRSDSGYATIRKSRPADNTDEDVGPTEVFDREDLLRW